MNNPFDFFDKIYCINLPESSERKIQVSKEFEKVNIIERVEWIYAPKPPKNFKIDLYNRNPAAEFGCSLSHINAIVNSIANKYDTILFMEDDVYFDDKINTILPLALNQLPKNWVGLYLGCVPVNKTKFSKNLVKISTFNTWGTWAYCLRGKYLLDFFEHWLFGITHGIAKNKYSPIDVILSSYLDKVNEGYAVYPPVVLPVPCTNTIIGECNNQALLDGHKKHWNNINEQ